MWGENIIDQKAEQYHGNNGQKADIAQIPGIGATVLHGRIYGIFMCGFKFVLGRNINRVHGFNSGKGLLFPVLCDQGLGTGQLAFKIQFKVSQLPEPFRIFVQKIINRTDILSGLAKRFQGLRQPGTQGYALQNNTGKHGIGKIDPLSQAH